MPHRGQASRNSLTKQKSKHTGEGGESRRETAVLEEKGRDVWRVSGGGRARAGRSEGEREGERRGCLCIWEETHV